MTRVLKILSYAVILFLIFLVITGFLKSCNKDQKVNTDVENASDIFEEDDIFESVEEDNENDDSDPLSESDPIDYDEIDATLADHKDKNTPSTEVDSYDNSAYSSGDYMVIAGNYIINTNAENMVLKLKKMGYRTAEIVVFDFSQYHSVVARRFDDYDDAYRLSRELVSKGIDSYVHEKKTAY